MRGRLWGQLVAAVFVAVIVAVAFCLLVAKIQDIIALFAVGFVIAYVLDPLLTRLENRGWSRARAVWTIMLSVVLVTGGLAAIIIPQLIGQIEDAVTHWPVYSERATALYQNAHDAATAYLQEHYPGYDVIPLIDSKVVDARQKALESLPTVLKWLSDRLLSSINLIALGGLVFIISFHFMLIIDAIRTIVVEAMPKREGESLTHISTQINAMLGQYVRGEAIACLLVAVVATVLLTGVKLIWGTNYGLIVGVVTGVTYVIPYVGPAISVSLAAFFGYVTATHDPLVACLVSAGAMVLVNQLFDTILTPKIVGGRIGLHPLVIMFAVFAGLKLMGVPGMIIATPVAASIKIALLRWLPIKGLEEGAPLPTQKPLMVDMGKTLARGIVWAHTVGQRIERASDAIERAITGEHKE